MRTPNTKCLLCEKPLYRRPHELIKYRYTACMSCRGRAQLVAGITDKQQTGLLLGRKKGTNNRTGYRHKPESRRKASDTHKKYWSDHPEEAIARAANTRGANHYRWNGGSSKLNTSIRQMTENRKWMDAIKTRDGKCVRCPSVNDLESHHKKSLAQMIAELGITSRDDARKHADVLWDLNNGITLCQPC